MSRVFVGERKTKDPAKTERAVKDAISDWQALEIKNALGQKFRATMQVRLVRPRWMPKWLYRRLMASVVIDNHLERKR
jgi:hypothetical protein